MSVETQFSNNSIQCWLKKPAVSSSKNVEKDKDMLKQKPPELSKIKSLLLKCSCRWFIFFIDISQDVCFIKFTQQLATAGMQEKRLSINLFKKDACEIKTLCLRAWGYNNIPCLFRINECRKYWLLITFLT